jgi:hypothetical protein
MRRNLVNGLTIFWILGMAMVWETPSRAADSEGRCRVEWVREKLTIQAEGASLGEVLAAIQEKTGVQFWTGQVDLGRSVSVRVSGVPMMDALKGLLRYHNYSFFLKEDGRLVKVAILKEGESQESLARLPVSGPGEEPPPTHAETAVTERVWIAGMVVDPPPRGGVMVITQPTEAMVIEPPGGEGMVVTPGGEEMVIQKPPSRGMEIKMD